MDLNIRNVDPKLIAKLKAEAALDHQTLRDHCIDRLAEGMPLQAIRPSTPQVVIARQELRRQFVEDAVKETVYERDEYSQ